MNAELSNIIMKMRDIPLNDRLSDEALIALSHSYVSMQNLVVAHALESDYGSRREFERALDSLYRICLGRCNADAPFERRCRLVPLLYTIVCMQMREVELKKSRECGEAMRRLVDEWMQNPELRGEHTSVYGMLRCISNLYYYVPDNDRLSKNDFKLFKQQVSEWAASMDGEGRWDGISSGEALCRIEVMSRNSNMFLDASYDELIEKARTSYCQSILESLRRFNGTPLQNCGLTLFMLCEIMMSGVGAPDYELMTEIAVSAKRQADQYPYGSDEWLFCQLACLDRLCMYEGDKIQEQMLANIA